MLRTGHLAATLFLVACVDLRSQDKVIWSAEEQPILDQLRGLRKLDDAKRIGVTRQLALDIRKLPAVPNKLHLANSLANLATEGDFGRDTLQEVTTTLAAALDEQPQPEPYMDLARLVRYEHMNVSSRSPQFDAAMKKLDEDDQQRVDADFALVDLKGKSWSLKQLKGSVVLVNFWATWCPPCRKEMPDLDALHKRFQKQGLVILAITDEDAAKVTPFIEAGGYKYPILLDPGRKVNGQFRIDGIPKSFVYDRDGKLAAQSIDMRTRGQFLEMLAAAGLK
jgi:peroxiredoxin